MPTAWGTPTEAEGVNASKPINFCKNTSEPGPRPAQNGGPNGYARAAALLRLAAAYARKVSAIKNGA